MRLFTIKEAAEALRIPISWLYERTKAQCVMSPAAGSAEVYVRFTEGDLKQIISAKR